MKFLLEHACAGLFADPGVGKTSAVFAAFKILKKQGLASKMLVVAPMRPMSMVWPKERDKWSDFRDFKLEVLWGKDKDKALARDADIYVINFEGLSWLLGVTSATAWNGKRKTVNINLEKFRKHGFDLLVIDELSRAKRTSTLTFKALKPILPTFSRRWGLTGSPAPNGLMDLFGQCYVLDMGRSLGQYITHYRTNYFNPHPSGFGWVIRSGSEKTIYERIRPLVLRLDANDYMDMPALVENRIMFDLPEKVRKVYDEVEDELLSQLDAGDVVAANAAAASSKCRQIANGGVYLDEENLRTWANLHTLKVDLLWDLVGELQGEPLLVAYDFRHDLDRLLLRFGPDVPYIGGGVTPKRALEIEAAWNAGEIPLLLGHPKSIGHGLNLQGAGHHVCWHSLTWDYELYDQFIGRVRRQGQKSDRVFVHHIMARDTIDEAIWWALHHKGRVQSALFEALKLRKKRRE